MERRIRKEIANFLKQQNLPILFIPIFYKIFNRITYKIKKWRTERLDFKEKELSRRIFVHVNS